MLLQLLAQARVEHLARSRGDMSVDELSETLAKMSGGKRHMRKGIVIQVDVGCQAGGDDLLAGGGGPTSRFRFLSPPSPLLHAILAFPAPISLSSFTILFPFMSARHDARQVNNGMMVNTLIVNVIVTVAFGCDCGF